MARALIQVNGVNGSQLDWPLDTIANLTNDDEGGETTYLWSVVDQPAGTVDSPSSTTIENPTFRPKKEGTYLLRLTVNAGTATESVNQVVLIVRTLKTYEGMPAAGESTESDLTRGWAARVNAFLARLDNRTVSQQLVAGVASGTIVAGNVTVMSGRTVLKSGLPGQESAPTMVVASPVTHQNQPLFLCLGRPNGGTTVANGETGLFMLSGLYTSGLGSVGAGLRVYLTNAGGLSVTDSATSRRPVATTLATGANPDIWFDGARLPAVQTVTWGLDTTTNSGGLTMPMPVGRGASLTLTTDRHKLPVPCKGVLASLYVTIDLAAHNFPVYIDVEKNGVVVSTVTMNAAATFGSARPNVAVVDGDVVACVLRSHASLSVAARNIAASVGFDTW